VKGVISMARWQHGPALARALSGATCVMAACGVLAVQAGASVSPRTLTQCTAPTITTPTTLTSAQVSSSYSDTLTGTCVPPSPSSWSITSGSLPTGLTLDSSTGVISGIAPGTVQTIPLTIQASGEGQTATEPVELPVVDTIKVDPAGGELTGATNDGTLAYFAGPTAGNVFDLDANNPPKGPGTAMTGLNFPAAVSTFDGVLYATQFAEPAANGDPVISATVPSSTSSSGSNQASLDNGDTGCSKPDGVSSYGGESFGFIDALGYTCAGSGEVLASTLILGSPFRLPGCTAAPFGDECQATYSLGAHSVPSGTAFDADINQWVAEAGSDNVVELGGESGVIAATVNLPKGSEPANVAYDSRNGILYVADPGTDQISQVDTGAVDDSTPSDLGEIDLPAGSRPFGVAVSSDGNTVVATDSGTDTANVIDVSGSTPVIEYSPQVGQTPDGVTIVGSEAYVADEQGGTVTVIDPPAATKSLLAPLVVTHHEPHAIINRAALRSARTEIKRLERAAKRHHTRLPSRRTILRDLRRALRTHKKRHASKAAHTAAVVNVPDPLVAPLPNPFSR
jgi:hypothetical protein